MKKAKANTHRDGHGNLWHRSIEEKPKLNKWVMVKDKPSISQWFREYRYTAAGFWVDGAKCRRDKEPQYWAYPPRKGKTY